MSNQKWDVIVIGGSFSGLSIGALLANEGKKVLILEKDSHPGGRMAAAEYKGHVIENGSHGWKMNGYTEEIFSRLGKDFPEIVTWSGMKIFHDGKWQDWGDLFPHGELRRIMKDEIMPRSYEELEELDDIPLKEWVSKNSKDEKTHLFFWPIGWMFGMGSSYAPISTGNVFIAIKEQLEKTGGFGNVAGEIPGGFITLVRTLVEAAREKGAEIRTGANVCGVTFEDGKVRGVEVDTGEKILPAHFIDPEFIEAEAVVSTVPIWNLFNIVSEDDFPRWYVDWIKDLSKRYVNFYQIYYGMDRVPMGDDSTSWFVTNLPRIGLPAVLSWFRTYGEAVGQHQACLWIHADWFENGGCDLSKINEPKVRREVRNFFDLVDKDIKELFPDLEKECLWKIRQATHYCIAEVPGTLRKHRPGIEPPGLENFFLSSDSLREVRPGGTQAAARVALQCVDKILGNKLPTTLRSGY